MFVEITDYEKARELHYAGLLWSDREGHMPMRTTAGAYIHTFHPDNTPQSAALDHLWGKRKFCVLLEE